MWTKSAHFPPSETSRRTFLKGSAAVAGGLVIGTYVDFGVRRAFAARQEQSSSPRSAMRFLKMQLL
jgi:TAT (twin-arginine translocation) pathway signal sequence